MVRILTVRKPHTQARLVTFPSHRWVVEPPVAAVPVLVAAVAEQPVAVASAEHRRVGQILARVERLVKTPLRTLASPAVAVVSVARHHRVALAPDKTRFRRRPPRSIGGRPADPISDIKE